MAAKPQVNTVSNNVHVFQGEVKMSAFQPIDIKPVYGRKWITNGINNINFQTYKNAYDDSPTNASIINAFVKDWNVVSSTSVIYLLNTQYLTPGYFLHIIEIHIAASIVLPHQAAHQYQRKDTQLSFNNI